MRTGWLFPHPPNVVPPTIHTLPKPLHETPMACFNWPNTTHYTNSTSSELNQASVFEQVDASAPETSTNGWSARGQQYDDDVSRWPTSLHPEANLGKRNCSSFKGRSLTYASPESTSCETQTQGYDQWIYPELYWPTTEQYSQPDYTTLNYDASVNVATLVAPELIPAPSNNEPSFLPRDFEESSAYRPQTDREDNQIVENVVGGQT